MSIDSTDQDLLARVRAGDTAAYGELYAHHSAAAHRAARRISRDPHIAQDLVSESFTRVFKALQADRGPRGDLFPYLLVTMRNVAATWGKSSARWSSVGDDTAFAPRDARDLVAGADEAPVDKMAVSMTTTAFGRLPSRWRTVLWYLEVEGESASEVGQRLGLSDVAVRQLARRAREGLREAYLGAYLGGVAVNGTHIPPGDLAQMARGTISIRRRGQVEQHLDTCPQCAGRLLEVAEENSTLRGLYLPLYLALGYGVIQAAQKLVGALRPRGRLFTRGEQGLQPAAVATVAGVAGVAVVAAVAVAIAGGGSGSSNAGGSRGGGVLVTSGDPSAAPSGSTSGPTAGAPSSTSSLPSGAPASSAPSSTPGGSSPSRPGGAPATVGAGGRAALTPAAGSAGPVPPPGGADPTAPTPGAGAPARGGSSGSSTTATSSSPPPTTTASKPPPRTGGLRVDVAVGATTSGGVTTVTFRIRNTDPSNTWASGRVTIVVPDGATMVAPNPSGCIGVVGIVTCSIVETLPPSTAGGTHVLQLRHLSPLDRSPVAAPTILVTGTLLG